MTGAPDGGAGASGRGSAEDDAAAGTPAHAGPRVLPVLQAIVDVDVAAAAGWDAVDLARAYLDGGARFLQLRAKRLASGPFLELCDEVVTLGRQAGALVIVNDRVDLARLSGAAGAHVGQDDLPVAETRSLLGAEAIVGTSTHGVAQARQALTEPATYVAVGPVFGTLTKDTGYAAVGLTLVSQTAALCGTRPVVGIGGITLQRAPSVIAAGAACVAVISDLLADGDPVARVRAFCRALDAAGHEIETKATPGERLCAWLRPHV